MTDAAHDYHSGDQDIQEQVATFGAFGKMMKWGSLTIAVLLIALVLWFCIGAGFFAGFGAAIVVAVAGFFFLREKPAATH